MIVFDLLKQVVIYVVSHFYTLLIELADAWYQNQLDAVTVIGDVIRSRSSSYSDVERSVREAIFASETENWHNRKEIVKRELESRVEYLRVVYDMLTTMGLSDSQADTVLNLLCSDKKITDDIREQLVTLYIDCLTLEPFTKGEGIMPIEGVNDVIKTSQKEKKLRFLLYVQSCLPITNKTEQLEDALAKAVSEISKEKIQSSLMHASGVKAEKCVATTTELAPDANKNGSKRAKQKRTTCEQKIPRECLA